MSALDPDALYVALDRQRRQRRMKWRDLAAESGVSPSTLTRIGQGHRPDADGLVRLLLWLGTTDLAPFIAAPRRIGGLIEASSLGTPDAVAMREQARTDLAGELTGMPEEQADWEADEVNPSGAVAGAAPTQP